MKQLSKEDKQLLLKDLSSRLPYGVKVNTSKGDGYLNEIALSMFGNTIGVNIQEISRDYFSLEECIPYLRPMSSMTQEEKKEFNSLINGVEERCINAYGKGGYTLAFTEVNDWLNANHFDYRGLIPMGLALEASEGMYNIKEE